MRSHGKASPAAFVSAGSTKRGSRSTFSLGVFAAMLVCAAAFLGLGASAAGAAQPVESFKYATTFGGGDFFFSSPHSALGVDADTGNIYAAAELSGKVNIYTPDPASGGVSYASIDTIALGGSPEGLYPGNIAVDSSDDSVYVAGTEGLFSPLRRVQRFVSDGADPPTYSLDPGFDGSWIDEAVGLAVDPATGDLLVAERRPTLGNVPGRVLRLDADGSLISSFDATAPPVEGGALAGLATGPAGKIYVVDGSRVRVFDADGTGAGELALAPGGTPKAVAVNPADGRIAVEVDRGGATYLDGLAAAGDLLFSTKIEAAGGAIGMGWDAVTGRIYYETSDASIQTLDPVTAPGLDDPVASDFTQTGAVVSATVAPGGEEATVHLEYCRADKPCEEFPVSDSGNPSNPWTAATGHTVSCVAPDTTCEVQIEDVLPLIPNRDWRVRVVASNANTNNTRTAAVSTPLQTPLVTTGSAGSVNQSSAELNGMVQPFGDLTTYHFEFGTDTTYGSQAPVGDQGPAGNGFDPRSVTEFVQGLQPSTTYHYRLVATNSAGTTAGDDRTFTTTAVGGTAPRAYEQVTPVDKQGAALHGAGHYQTAEDGNAMMVATAQASTEAESSEIYTNYVTHRTDDGWENWKPTDPPRLPSAPHLGLESQTFAASDDFNHAFVVTNKPLTDGEGYENGGNFYIRNLSDNTYTFVGASPNEHAWYDSAAIASTLERFWKAAPDFSWIYFWSPDPLLPGVSNSALYRWSRVDGLSVFSTLPDGTVPSAGVSELSNEVLPPRISKDGKVAGFSLDGGGVYRRVLGEASEAISVSQISGDPNAGVVQPGHIEGLSANGRYIFFSSNALLTDNATLDPENLANPLLYRYDAVAAHDSDPATKPLEYIAPVNAIRMRIMSESGDTAVFFSGAGTQVWRQGTIRTVTSGNPWLEGYAFLSPNGRYLLYYAQSTGNEAYRFDTDTGETVCVSCRADDQPATEAVGFSPGNNLRYPGNQQRPNAILDDGTAFFDAADRLTSEDHNGRRDVYEFHDGRQKLISPGNQDFNAIFWDATPDGSNVFFATDQSLVGQDTDGETDIYDARVGGGIASQNPAPTAECVGDACQGLPSTPPTVPNLGSNGSGAPGKPGNHARKHKTHCKKKHQGKKKACKGSKKHGSRHAGSNRRSGR